MLETNDCIGNAQGKVKKIDLNFFIITLLEVLFGYFLKLDIYFAL